MSKLNSILPSHNHFNKRIWSWCEVIDRSTYQELHTYVACAENMTWDLPINMQSRKSSQSSTLQLDDGDSTQQDSPGRCNKKLRNKCCLTSTTWKKGLKRTQKSLLHFLCMNSVVGLQHWWPRYVIYLVHNPANASTTPNLLISAIWSNKSLQISPGIKNGKTVKPENRFSKMLKPGKRGSAFWLSIWRKLGVTLRVVQPVEPLLLLRFFFFF